MNLQDLSAGALIAAQAPAHLAPDPDEVFATPEFDFSAQVAAGVAWLDTHRPGWLFVFTQGGLHRLDLGDVKHCVLGMIYGSFWRSPLASAPGSVAGMNTTYQMGFALDTTDDEAWHALTQAWVQAIGELLAARR